MAIPGVAWATGLSVSTPIIVAQDTTSDYYDIQMDVAWNNSWFITGAPASNANWDAAWLFVKFSIWNSGSSSWGGWQHATLSKTTANHYAPSGSLIAVGCSPSSACGGADAGKGILLYRDSAGTGSVNFTGTRLRWLYGADGVSDSDRVKISVFGIEMVYIPTASFFVGDGSANPAGNFGVVQVNNGSFSGNIIADSTYDSNDDDATIRGGGISAGSLNAGFPTGYNKFYVMKYDITQRQYAAFLNTLTRTQQSARVAADISADAPDYRYVMSAFASVQNRDAIAAPASGNGTTAPITFGCDLDGNSTLDEASDGGWDTAVNLNWPDTAAYLTWAGLRPVTELEFEKASRGPSAVVADEYAWGDASVYNIAGVSNDYALSSAGTNAEGVSNTAAGTGNAAYYETSCDNGPNYNCGPLRAGIFAASAATKNRQETGGSYYGVMGLSGNVWKFAVTVGNATGRAYDGTHGSGALSAAGYAAQAAWPGYVAGEVTGATGSGFRGGGWISQATSMRVSDRSFASVASTTRANVYSARGAHTAP
ncbi:MAG: SUMF1/EgtB/PvdO family nonheme iron enzyme [Candidatus Omnitrophota bacterium]